MRPTRIVDEDGFEAELLRTALDEEPPRGAIGRAEAALGIGVGAGFGVTAAATTTAKAASAHLGATHVVAQAGAASIAKWVGIGMVSGLVVTGGARYAADPALREVVFRRSVPSNSAPAVSRPPARRHVVATKSESLPVAPAPVEALPAAAPPAEIETTHNDVVEAPPLPARRDVPRAAGNDPAHVASIAGEVSILERARRALVAHQPDVVLRELDAYDRTVSAGVFGPEAEMLAIEALLQQGRTTAAQQRAARAVRRSPNGPHAARLRDIAAFGR